MDCGKINIKSTYMGLRRGYPKGCETHLEEELIKTGFEHF